MSEITKYCKVTEAKNELGVSRETIVNMIRDGRIRAKKFGDKHKSPWYIERESLVAWKK